MAYISPNKALAHIDRLAAWARGDQPAPVTIEWDLTNRCSLGCEFCHFAHTHEKGPWAGKAVLPMAYDSTGDEADTALVIRVLGEAAQSGVQGIIWSGGGEPTLHPSWQEIVAQAGAYDLRQGMYTLGGHLKERSAAHLAQYVDWVVVSLDCADATSYSNEKRVPPARFYAACDGVRWLAEAGQCVVGVSYLLHAGNWRRLDAMVALSRQLGATYTTFRPTIITDVHEPSLVREDVVQWIDDALPEIERISREPDIEADPERFRVYRAKGSHGYPVCYGVRLSTNITPDGRVWLCPQRRGIAGSCVGDLRTESFIDVWRRHPGRYEVDRGCRAMCRFHLMNGVLDEVFKPRVHSAFV